jgi:hypothetical protein
VLHASAVRTSTGAALAFIGASGVGKSTLAQRMSARGLVTLSDDLLPVRFNAGGHGVAVPLDDEWVPLARIYFLSRAEGPLHDERLAAPDALERLIHNGFGEIHNPRAWQHLFDAYHRIAGAVPSHTLTARAGIENIDETIDHVLSALDEGRIAWED